MGANYIINKYFGFKIPSNITQKDWKLLEKLYENEKLIEDSNYIFFKNSKINIICGRLSHYTKVRLGNKIYPSTYIKIITKDDYSKSLELSDDKDLYNLLSELIKLSFKPQYEYFEHAYISY